MHFAAHFFHKTTRMHTFCLILVGFLISTAISPLREQLLTAVWDRRAVYVDMSSSVAYLSFWLGLWFALLLRWRNTLQTLDGRYAVIILSILVMNVIFSGYSTRFVAAAFPSLLIAMAEFRSKPPQILIGIFSAFSLLQWLYWFKILGS